jgi:hypothetical protein
MIRYNLDYIPEIPMLSEKQNGEYAHEENVRESCSASYTRHNNCADDMIRSRIPRIHKTTTVILILDPHAF